MHTAYGIMSTAAAPRQPRDANQLFNAYRKGLTLFVLFDRNGRRHGYLYAGSSYAAGNRAQHIVGSGATVEYAE